VARRVDVGSACVDIPLSPKTDVLASFCVFKIKNYFICFYFLVVVMKSMVNEPVYMIQLAERSMS